MSGICELLEWDTQFFGYRIARVVGHQLDASTLNDVLAYCKSNRIDLLYFLADPTDLCTTWLAEEAGFHMVDIRVELEREVDRQTFSDETLYPRRKEIDVREAYSEDIDYLQKISRRMYLDSRFYYDPILHSRADELYATWIKKSVEGLDDVVIVATMEEQPVGYISVRIDSGGIGHIGLLGVAADRQGKGIGRILVEASIKWCAARGVKQMRVVTQGRNIKALRLYTRRSFVVLSMHVWYHKWFIYANPCITRKTN